MRIYVSFDIDDDTMLDPSDNTGLTEPAFLELNEHLMEFGADDIAVSGEGPV